MRKVWGKRQTSTDFICSCSDSHVIEDVRRWVRQMGMDTTAFGVDVPTGAAQLVVGNPGRRSELMEEICLLSQGVQTIWLIVHENCKVIRDSGLRFRSREEEHATLIRYLREARNAIAMSQDPRIKSVGDIRMVLGKLAYPEFETYEFEEIDPPGRHAARNSAPPRIRRPAAAAVAPVGK